jgi:PhnB protein
MSINTYLMFNGQCEEAFTFYAKLLGGKIQMMMKHKGSPAESHTPPEWLDKILHGRMTIGDQVLMASDSPPDRYQKPQGFFVSINLKDPNEAERIYNALAKDGTVHMPMQETFFAAKFGMLVDRFSIPWMVNCEKGGKG